MKPINTVLTISFAAIAGLTIASASNAEVPSRPGWINQAMELQDELRKEGYTVVWGEGPNCEARNLPKNKIAVVCGENPVNDLRKALRAVKQGSFLF